MAPHSSPLAWKIPWTKEPSGLQSMGSLGVGHDSVTSLSVFTFMHWRRKWQPTPVFLPGESQGQQSLEGCHLYEVAQSRTWLKRLSSSSSHPFTTDVHQPLVLSTADIPAFEEIQFASWFHGPDIPSVSTVLNFLPLFFSSLYAFSYKEDLLSCKQRWK